MPASRIESALRERVPEVIVAWCNGQSLESRYSTSVPGPVGGGPARVAAGAILRDRFVKARRPDAVDMPRFPVLAASAGPARNDLDAELAVMAKVAVWKAKRPIVSVTIAR